MEIVGWHNAVLSGSTSNLKITSKIYCFMYLDRLAYKHTGVLLKVYCYSA